MPTLKLSDHALKKIIPPADGQDYYWDSTTSGLGVVVGKTVQTFVARAWVGKLRRRVKIGIVGAPYDGPEPEKYAGQVWTVDIARKRALVLLGEMATGHDPNATTRAARASGPTLRDGMDAHLARMRKKGRAERSLDTLTNELEKYLGTWLDKPIAELTGAVLVQLHETIKTQAKARNGSNPGNAKGAPLANRVVTHVSACWNSLNRQLEGKLGSWNPAKAVDRDVLKPKRQRLDDADLPDWAARVATMRNPIQRDGLNLALYTGLRSEDVRSIRWEHVDWKERSLTLPDPKGGEGAAFKIPLSATPLAILKKRKKENAASAFLSPHGGDGGWAFPSVSNDGEVGPIGDLRQQVHGDTHGRFPVEDVHSLRRTWESIAHEEGVSELDQHVLSNHSFGSRNVNQTYISQHLDHLASCASKIDAGITKRLKVKRARRA